MKGMSIPILGKVKMIQLDKDVRRILNSTLSDWEWGPLPERPFLKRKKTCRQKYWLDLSREYQQQRLKELSNGKTL